LEVSVYDNLAYCSGKDNISLLLVRKQKNGGGIDWGLMIPFRGDLKSLKVLPFPKSISLGTKPPIHGPVGDILNQNYSTWL
jgi:hypothetical protein